MLVLLSYLASALQCTTKLMDTTFYSGDHGKTQYFDFNLQSGQTYCFDFSVSSSLYDYETVFMLSNVNGTSSYLNFQLNSSYGIEGSGTAYSYGGIYTPLRSGRFSLTATYVSHGVTLAVSFIKKQHSYSSTADQYVISAIKNDLFTVGYYPSYYGSCDFSVPSYKGFRNYLHVGSSKKSISYKFSPYSSYNKLYGYYKSYSSYYNTTLCSTSSICSGSMTSSTMSSYFFTLSKSTSDMNYLAIRVTDSSSSSTYGPRVSITSFSSSSYYINYKYAASGPDFDQSTSSDVITGLTMAIFIYIGIIMFLLVLNGIAAIMYPNRMYRAGCTCFCCYCCCTDHYYHSHTYYSTHTYVGPCDCGGGNCDCGGGGGNNEGAAIILLIIVLIILIMVAFILMYTLYMLCTVDDEERRWEEETFYKKKSGDTTVVIVNTPIIQPDNSMVQPMMGQPMMGQPMMGQPMMGQPMMGQPMMGQPMMGQPMMGQPMMGQPMPTPVYSQEQIANPYSDSK